MPLIHHRLAQGEPIRVGRRQIVPEARVTWWMQRRATIQLDGESGWGAGMVRIRPTALLERGPAGERRIPLRDETARLLIGVAVGALFVYFLAEIATKLAMLRGGRKS